MKVTFVAAFANCAALCAPAIATAQETPSVEAAAPDLSTTVEYYYRIKWGSIGEFVELYEKNHAPLLEEAKKAGFIVSMKTEYPFTHMAGGVRWDMRVTIKFRDAVAAINDPAWESLWSEATKRLYKDRKKFDAEEKRRFSLLEDHWDVIVVSDD